LKRRRAAIVLASFAAVLFACNAILGIDGDILDRDADGSSPEGSAPPPGGGSLTALHVDPPALEIKQGETKTIKVKPEGSAKNVEITFSSLPVGVTAPSKLVPVGQESDVEITASVFAPLQPVATPMTIHANGQKQNIDVTVGGNLDTQFGEGGTVVIPFGAVAVAVNEADPIGLAVEDDGHILVVFSTGAINAHQVAVARVAPNGKLDTTYGDGGIFVTNIVPPDAGSTVDDRGNTAAIVGTKQLVIGGTRGGSKATFAVVNATPQLQTAAVFHVLKATSESITGIAVDDGGLLLLDQGGNAESQVVRMLVNGSIDTSYADGGARLVGVNGTIGSEIVAGPTRSFVLGSTLVTSLPHPLVAATQANGTPDIVFGANGNKVLNPPAEAPMVRAATGVLAGDGKIYAFGPCGGVLCAFELDPASAGTVASFGDGGFAAIDPQLDGGDAIVPFATMETDGGFLVGGFLLSGSIRNALVTRVDATGKIDPAFGVAGSFRLPTSDVSVVKRFAAHQGGVVAAIALERHEMTTPILDVMLVRYLP
jgi:hypothetical protein